MQRAPDNFIDVPFADSNLDLYIVRSSILRAINENIHVFKGSLLDIGCGKMPYRSFLMEKGSVVKYTGLDIESAKVYDSAVRPDVTWDGHVMPFDNDTFDSAFGTEVLEHCPDPVAVLKETLRVIKPGATFFFTTPFLWNLHEVPFDEYRYTPFSMERILRSAGFRDIEVKAAGGWHASMAQMLGLWVRRSPLPPRKRKIFSAMLKPVIKKLIAMARTEKIDFNKGPMITTLYGAARK